MAVSRDYIEEHQSLRPSRIRRIPGHLEDFVLTSQPRQLVPPPLQEDLRHMQISETFPDLDADYRTSTPDRLLTEQYPEATRLRRVEECVWNVQEQIRELQSTLQMSLEQGKGSPRMHQDLLYSHAAGAGHQRSVPHPGCQQQSIQQRSASLPFLYADTKPSPQSPYNLGISRYFSQKIPAHSSTTVLPQSHSQSPVHLPSGSLPQAQKPLSRPASVPVTERHVAPHVPRPGSAPAGMIHQSNVNQQPGDLQQTFQPQVQLFGQQSVPPMISMSTVYRTVTDNQSVYSLPMTSVQSNTVNPNYVQPQITQSLPAFAPSQTPMFQYSEPPPRQSVYYSDPYTQGYRPNRPPDTRLQQQPYSAPLSSTVHPAVQVPSMVDMAIASAYGIPKPKLINFTTGKESDFALLKKGLDGILGPHLHLTEDYKFQVLLDHLKLPAAFQIAKRYMYDPMPYTRAMQALQHRYGQPRQLVQGEIANILHTPPLRSGDAQGFEDFALSVNTLVGLLNTLEGSSKTELMCGSHVDRLLTKLTSSHRDSFVEYCMAKGILQNGTDRTYTLPEFAEWLEKKSQALQISRRAAEIYSSDKPRSENREQKPSKPPKVQSTIYYGMDHANEKPSASSTSSLQTKVKKRESFKPYCPFCKCQQHYLNSCPEFDKLSVAQITTWIKDSNKCWRCGRGHEPSQCTLKKPCSKCGEQHLSVLHDVASNINKSILTVNTVPRTIYLDQVTHSGRVMLKVVQVKLHSKGRIMDTYAILDDGSERTIILPTAVHYLDLDKSDESLSLRTIRQEVVEIQGASVSFEVSASVNPSIRHKIHTAFTSQELNIAKQSCPIETLKHKFAHLRGVPILPFKEVQPMLLIGSDYPQLITPITPVLMGPLGSPVAVNTHLGWAIQGPTTFLDQPLDTTCLNISLLHAPTQDLSHHVEKLWQVDILPFQPMKDITRSKQDRDALQMLETRTKRVEVDGVSRYATPLLRKGSAKVLHAGPESVMALLRATERRLNQNSELADIYNKEIHKLEQAGYAIKITPEEAKGTKESWFIPHHLVQHNNKARVVFNCSYQFRQASLNDQLLPGPTLGSSLLGVLLRFRQYPVAISGDIRSMFHQVRLLPEDQPLLRFLWRDMEKERSPDIYEWRVLPFGTTSSPCCAIYALQRHALDHRDSNEEVAESVLKSFYVDNCLQSLPTTYEAKQLIDKMRAVLSAGGFEIRQWASNYPEVIAHLPTEARSESCELWLTVDKTDPQESTLGLSWHCLSDKLGYRNRPLSTEEPTMRNIYRVLASQYDPLGYILPYTTRAKILVQALWINKRGWDDCIENEMLNKWQEWTNELQYLPLVNIPRCYFPICPEPDNDKIELHIFCDASERAYGSVAYLRLQNKEGGIHTSFVMARSRVAPKKQLSMPRLELCGALTGAQLAKLLSTEITLPIHNTVLWTDSTTVLTWIKSESCQYKVFVGTRIAEIQELTSPENWRYVNSELNPADDITRGKSLKDLSHVCQWTQGPRFLQESTETWPTQPFLHSSDENELRKSLFCAHVAVFQSSLPDPEQHATWADLVQATYQSVHGTVAPAMSASQRIDTELLLLRQAQQDSFPDEVHALQNAKVIRANSRLSTLSPEYDQTMGLIRVGGRLRKAEKLEIDTLHPIVLAPDHPITKLIIQDYDNRLLHPGPERVFAEVRRTYWIIRGRQAIKKYQHQCRDCRQWRSNPVNPKMADLPAARLRLYQPPFWSTGVDCFRPFTVKIGRRHEKRWGIIFKCLTTRCIHLDLLHHMDTDSFLMALRRFIARRGKPFELISDQGTNFRGGNRELQESFSALEPAIKEKLSEQSISFQFNPPYAPHFGGAWEREIRSVKSCLQVVLKDQIVSDEVLLTVLIEVEGILNSKPLGYVSSEISDADPVTPNLLLMGRRDASLPQVVYGTRELLGKRKWRHSQVIADQFWKQFIQNYLPSLQPRAKWLKSTPNISVGQVVMVMDSQLPRALWPVGRVNQVVPSSDGTIRVAEVTVGNRVYSRPVSKLIVLPEMPTDTNGT